MMMFSTHAGRAAMNQAALEGQLQQKAAGVAAGMTELDPLHTPNISNITLVLSSAPLEQRFWRSVKVLRLLDLVGLFNSVMLNVMLIRKFGFGRDQPDMLWHFLPVLLYLSAGLVQMAVLIWRPQVHQRNRFAINLANRLVKAATVTWAAVNMSQTDVMNQFAGTLNSVPLAIAGEHSMTAYMKIIRTVASLPMLWVSHAVNFMLPFWLLLPLQLYTLLAVSKVIPSIACVLLGQPPHILQPAAVIATYVHGFVRLMIAVALPMPYQWPWQVVDSSSNGRAPDMAAKDLLVLVAVTFAMILMVIPCTVAYHVELLWKTDFLQAQTGTADADIADAASGKKPWFLSPLWVTFDIVCLTLLVCESITQLAPELQCDCRH